MHTKLIQNTHKVPHQIKEPIRCEISPISENTSFEVKKAEEDVGLKKKTRKTGMRRSYRGVKNDEIN